MKKKQVVVVKRIEKPSPKKGMLVSRKLNAEDGRNYDIEKSMIGNSSPQHPIRTEASWASRSILGNPANFDTYFEDSNGDSKKTESVKSRPLSRVGTTNSLLSSGHSSSSKKKHSKQNCDREPLEEPELYLQALNAMQAKAKKLRARELEKEENLLQYLPVNERFDLNKEGKVLAMWQERQKKWDHIQRQLAKRVGGTTNTLMMNTGDEFRAKNEEYDVLQAAVPIQERFGAESWQMQLRGGAERAVSIGHVFSGLTCEVSTRRVNPAIIRKPRKPSDEKTMRKQTFVDPTPSLLHRKKQLQKTLTTLRPHNLGPADVEGLVVGSQGLFDWAISSSEKYFCDLAAATTQAEANASHVEVHDTQEKDSVEDDPNHHPQLAFLSSRYPLFCALQAETVHRVISFKNCGPTAISYSWKKVPSERDSESTRSGVMQVMMARDDPPRAHLISEQRQCFFCRNPAGEILPGEYVDCIFSFCSKGSGGTFHETWVLDTTPKAVVRFPTSTSTAGKEQRTPVTTDESGGSERASNVQLPSVVYVFLKGHAVTVDEHHHRRAYISSMIGTDCNKSYMADQTYLSLRRVRPPVTRQELEERKIALFKEVNSDFLIDMYSAFATHDEVQLTYGRLESFIKLNDDVKTFARNLHSAYTEKRILARDLPSPVEDVDADQLLPAIYNVDFLPSMRVKLFPENVIETFDEIDESEICSYWDYNVTALKAQLDTCEVVAETVRNMEVAIQKHAQLLEKERIREEKRALDSDYEDEEDEDEEATEGGDGSVNTPMVHYLVGGAHSLQKELGQLVINLIVRDMPCSVFDAIQRNLSSAFDDMDNFKEISMQKASLKDDVAIPIIPSPFTTEEGESFWESVLVPDIPPTGKKGAAKGGKGAMSDEQKKTYYGSMYQLIFNAFSGAVVQGLCEIDATMDKRLQCKLQSTHSNDFHLLAAARDCDIAGKSHVFIKINGSAFLTDISTSAFDVNMMSRREAASPIVRSGILGAAHVVLVFDDKENLGDATLLEGAATTLSAILESELEALPRAQQKLIVFCVRACPTLAKLSYYIKTASAEVTPDNRRVVNVFLLNNMACQDIVPSRTPYSLDESDDESDAIPVGIEEWKSLMFHNWESKEPEVVSVDVLENGEMVKIDVSTNVGIALNRLVESVDGVWMEGDMHSLFPRSTDTFAVCHRAGSVASDRIREMALWLHAMCCFQWYSSSFSAILESGDDSLPHHLRGIFPASGPTKPKFLVTLGGTIRPDKFRVLDYLLDMADTVVIGGELCIPFLMCAGVQFVDLPRVSSLYCGVCNLLLRKARLRGVNIILPVDLLTGDEVVTSAQLLKCCENIDMSSRDEGGDYEGDTTVVLCSENSIAGVPYDIGPKTQDLLREVLASHQLHLSWGTLGCCEISSFQSGQKVLSEAASAESLKEGQLQDSETATHIHNIVIGESSAEWWTRFCDADGEYEGNLIKKGVVDFCSRSSFSIASCLGQISSLCLSDALRRDPNDDEWDYLTRIRSEPEEDEDEEEEEEDDE